LCCVQCGVACVSQGTTIKRFSYKPIRLDHPDQAVQPSSVSRKWESEVRQCVNACKICWCRLCLLQRWRVFYLLVVGLMPLLKMQARAVLKKEDMQLLTDRVLAVDASMAMSRAMVCGDATRSLHPYQY